MIYTGGGKTRCGSMAYEALNKPRTLVVTSRVPILDQWKKALRGGNVQYACIQSAYKIKGNFDLVIIDEVHRALSPKYRAIFANVNAKHLMCLTATLPNEEEYVDFLTKTCPVIYEKKIKEALEEGMVPQFELYNLPVPIHKSISGKYKMFDAKFTQAMIKLTRILIDNPKLRSKYKNVFELAQAAQWNTFDKETQGLCKSYWAGMTMRKQLVYSNPAKLAYIREVINVMGRDRKWIIFTKSIAFAKAVQEYLGGTALYHSKMKPIEKELQLLAFEQGQFNIMVAVDALNEGINVTGVDAAICAAGVSTELSFTQQQGRILRPEKGKKDPIFVNLYTDGTVERTWVEKKLKASGLKSTWLKSTKELPRQALISL